MTQEIQTTTPTSGALTIGDVRGQVQLIQQVMTDLMKENEHYGVIPGTKKPTLLKPGAEKLCLTFRLDPQYDVDQVMDGDHLTVFSKCTIYHSPSGTRLGSGCGSCSTKEAKYAYRMSNRKCPKCEQEAIIRGKEEYGGGWICYKKKGGCGAGFKIDDPLIADQKEGRVPNEDIPDQYNTVLKMANKRSLVAAVLVVTAASDIFAQDIEETAVQETIKAQPVSANPKPEPAKVYTPEVVTPKPTPTASTTTKTPPPHVAGKALTAQELEIIRINCMKVQGLPSEIKQAFAARNMGQKAAAAWCETKGWDVAAIRHELALDVEDAPANPQSGSDEDIPF